MDRFPGKLHRQKRPAHSELLLGVVRKSFVVWSSWRSGCSSAPASMSRLGQPESHAIDDPHWNFVHNVADYRWMKDLQLIPLLSVQWLLSDYPSSGPLRDVFIPWSSHTGPLLMDESLIPPLDLSTMEGSDRSDHLRNRNNRKRYITMIMIPQSSHTNNVHW